MVTRRVGGGVGARCVAGGDQDVPVVNLEDEESHSHKVGCDVVKRCAFTPPLTV